MCIPHAPVSIKRDIVIKEKEKKHIEKVSKLQYEKGDPDFIDERTSKYKPKKKPSFLESVFGI